MARAAAASGRDRRPWAQAGIVGRGAHGGGECRAARASLADRRGAAAPGRRQSAGLGAAGPLPVPCRRGPRGGLRHDRDRAPSGRSGGDIPAAAGARLGRLWTGGDAGGGRSSTGFSWRVRCSAYRVRALTEIAGASGLADRRRSEQRQSSLRPRADAGAHACLGRAGSDIFAAWRKRRPASAAPRRRSIIMRRRCSAKASAPMASAWWRAMPMPSPSAPEEVALRALALILRAVGGAAYTPELDSVEALRSAILASAARRCVEAHPPWRRPRRNERTPHGAPGMGPRRIAGPRRRRRVARWSGTGASAHRCRCWTGALEIGPLGRSGCGLEIAAGGCCDAADASGPVSERNAGRGARLPRPIRRRPVAWVADGRMPGRRKARSRCRRTRHARLNTIPAAFGCGRRRRRVILASTVLKPI